MFAGRSRGVRMTTARTSSPPEGDLFVYDGQVLAGFVDHTRGRWRAVARGRELGRFGSREEALAALHDLIDEFRMRKAPPGGNWRG